MPIVKLKSNTKVNVDKVNVTDKITNTGIHKYRIVNPVKDTKLPFFDERKGIFYVPLKSNYRYYVACITPNTDGDVDYHILLGKTKFNPNVRLCHTDDYGRVQIKIKGEIRDYIIKESIERGNVQVTYIETTLDYDVFEIS